MPFHPFCSQGQNEQNAANAFRTNHSYSRMVDKKTRPMASCKRQIPVYISRWGGGGGGGGRGGGGAVLNKVELKTLTLLYTIFDRKVTPLVYL